VPPSVKLADPLAALLLCAGEPQGRGEAQVVLDRQVYRAHMEATGELLPGVAT
jgi:hypothetical protein